MLSKNKIDKKLKEYVKEHLSKGYSKHSVRKMLVSHGYDENYVDVLLKKNSELEFVKKYAVFVSFLFIASIFSFYSILDENQQQKITTFAVSNPEKYFVLDANYNDGSLAFNKIQVMESDEKAEYPDKSGYLVKIVSIDGSDIYSFYYSFLENKNYQVYIPHSDNAGRIEIYNLKNSKVMEIEISSLNTENRAEFSNQPPNMPNWIFLMFGIVILTLIFLFLKINKENKIISSLKQYFDESIRKGFTLQQIKDTLLKEGYTQKEIEKASRAI